MSIGASAGAAAAAAALAQATKASGVIVRVEPEAFLLIVDLNDEPLAIHATGSFFFSKTHKYLTSYRGFAFFTESTDELALPEHCQIVESTKIWIPA